MRSVEQKNISDTWGFGDRETNLTETATIASTSTTFSMTSEVNEVTVHEHGGVEGEVSLGPEHKDILKRMQEVISGKEQKNASTLQQVYTMG